MAAKSLPPGFRFHPTDEELVGYYLKRKVHAWKIELDIIPEVDLYKCEPWDLPDKSFLPGRDLEWYFFSLRDKKYPNGLRTNRATEAGYWKATGKDRKVISHMRLIGMKKTLVFHTGRAPHGSRTDWVMHEYRLEETECEASTSFQEGYALCRVFKKRGLGRRIGVECSAFPDNDFSSGQSNTCNKSLLLSLEEQSEEKASLSSPGDDEDQTNSREASSEAINTMNVDDGVWKRWLQPVNDDTVTCNFPRLNESISHPKVDHNETSGSPLKDGGFPHIKSCLSLSDSTTLSAYLLGEHVHPSVKAAVIIGQHHRYEQTSEQNTDIPKNEDYLQDDDFVPGWNIQSDHKNPSNYNAQEETDLFLLSSSVSQNCNMESFYEQQEQLLFFNHFLRQNSNPENLAFMLT